MSILSTTYTGKILEYYKRREDFYQELAVYIIGYQKQWVPNERTVYNKEEYKYILDYIHTHNIDDKEFVERIETCRPNMKYLFEYWKELNMKP